MLAAQLQVKQCSNIWQVVNVKCCNKLFSSLEQAEIKGSANALAAVGYTANAFFHVHTEKSPFLSSISMYKTLTALDFMNWILSSHTISYTVSVPSFYLCFKLNSLFIYCDVCDVF